MTFLNPFVLLGLAAASVPLILHLLHLRKLRTIEFSSVRFLQELQKTRIRKLKIRQWLLLVIRTLLVIMIVLAFARPALTGSLSEIVGTRASTTMIIIVDDSPSMSVRSDKGELLTQARGTAAQLLALGHEGDKMYVFPLSELRHPDQIPLGPSNASSSTGLDRIELSRETVPYLMALKAAEGIASATSSANKECYIISDVQATQFLLPETQSDTVAASDQRLKAFVLEIPHTPPINAGVSEVALRSQIIARDKPVSLRAEVFNAGDIGLHNAVISAYLNGRRVSQQTVDVGPGATAAVDFTIVPKMSGILDGYIQLDEDAFEQDNRRWFVLDVPDSITILLLGADARDTKLASLALLPGGDSALTGLFRVRTALEAQLPSVDFATIDVIAACDIRDFSDIEADRIAQFVRSGGGLAIFPGPSSNLSNYNQTLFSKLGIPPASAPQGSPTDSPAENSGTLSFNRVDFSHPVLADIFERPAGTRARPPSIESPAIRNSIGISAGPRGRGIITLPNGHDFLDEHNPGEGRVFLFAVDAGLAWSDFAIKGIFAPLLHRSMVYLCGASRSVHTYTTGDAIEFFPRLRHVADNESYVVKSPSGLDERVTPHRAMSSGFAAFSTKNSKETGIYELFKIEPAAGSGAVNHRIGAVAVNIDAHESDLRPIRSDELRKFWDRAGFGQGRGQHFTTDAPLIQEIEQTRFGTELWRYFLGLAVLLALAEMMLGRAPRQKDPPDQQET